MAQRGVNKVILLGNLGQDPDVRHMPSGGAVTTISIATSESWRDKTSGEQRDKTEWHRVVFMGKLAEIAGEYLHKGSQVYVEGKLQTRKWQDQSGQERYTTEVMVDSFSGVLQMVGGKPQNDNQAGQQSAPRAQGQQTRQSPPPVYNEPPMDFDDDIPF